MLFLLIWVLLRKLVRHWGSGKTLCINFDEISGKIKKLYTCEPIFMRIEWLLEEKVHFMEFVIFLNFSPKLQKRYFATLSWHNMAEMHLSEKP